MLWRVGDGSQIQVFHDNWILGCFATKAIPLTQAVGDDSNVCSLIDQTTKDWNGQMIDQKIAPSMAQRIKVIPLCRMIQEDYLVWPQSPDGNYSVKTGYQLLGQLENKEAASGSNNADLRNF
nr:hypothetical protein CFP56_13829 [Quercus suber]